MHKSILACFYGPQCSFVITQNEWRASTA